MRHNILGLAFTAASVLALGACAPSLRGADRGVRPANDVLVTVQNHNWADVNVYVVRAGTRMRLGTVMSMNQAVFTVPSSMFPSSTDVRLLIDPIGSRNTLLTEPILASEGQTIEMRVENNLQLTNWSVW